MNTQFTQKIADYLDNKISEPQFHKWYDQQPEIERPDILRELKATIDDRFDVPERMRAVSKEVYSEIDRYEDLILTSKLSNEMLSIEKGNVVSALDKLVHDLHSLRATTLYLLKNTDGDVTNIKKTAKKLMDAEKELNIYNPENWKELLE